MSVSAMVFLTGTLIIMTPTSEGLVVAADSRSVRTSPPHTICDRDVKIREVGTVDRTVVTLIGTSGGSGICGQEAVTFNLLREFAQFVEGENKNAAAISIASFASTLQGLFERLSPENRKAVISTYVENKRFAQVIVASFDDKRLVSTVRSAIVTMTAQTGFTVTHERVDSFPPDANLVFLKFGVTTYADSEISNGELKKLFVDPATSQLLAARARVKTVKKPQAIRATTDIINAVAARMQTAPIKTPWGTAAVVGGPVDVLFLGKDARPERVQWKN